MKRFFNLPTIVVLAIVAAAIIAEVLSPTGSFLTITWMVAYTVWAVVARLTQMEAEDWKQHYDDQTNALKAAERTLYSTADELAELRRKYEALTYDKQDLFKQFKSQSVCIDGLEASLDSRMLEINELRGKYEAAVQELAQANQKVNELTQNISARKPTIKLKTKKHKTPEDKE